MLITHEADCYITYLHNSIKDRGNNLLLYHTRQTTPYDVTPPHTRQASTSAHPTKLLYLSKLHHNPSHPRSSAPPPTLRLKHAPVSKMTELSFAKSFLSTLDNRPVKLPADHVADLKTLELKGPVCLPHTFLSLTSFPPFSPLPFLLSLFTLFPTSLPTYLREDTHWLTSPSDGATQYTLPRYPSSPSMQPPTSTPSSTTATSTPHPPSSTPPETITLHLKSLRSPPLSLSLPSTSLSTSIHELKQKVANELGRSGTEGIKILFARKPAADTKTVREVLGAAAAEEPEVEMQVMVVGGSTLKGGEGEEEGGKEKGDVEMAGTEGVPVAQGISGEEVLGSDAFWDDLRGWLMQRVRDEGVVGDVWGAFKRGWDERSL
ncbi:MAG: hypothetical protein Q9184_004146 [Pyrenodesmia sp. 2 TL-2023]